MSLPTTAFTVAKIVEALERDADELENIRRDTRLHTDNIQFQTNKVAIHAANHIVASASMDGSPFAWFNGNTAEWDRWNRFCPGIPLRADQLCQASDSQLVDLLEFPVFFYLLIEHFPHDFDGLIDEWPRNGPAPKRAALDHQQLRNRGLETVCRNAATLLRAQTSNIEVAVRQRAAAETSGQPTGGVQKVRTAKTDVLAAEKGAKSGDPTAPDAAGQTHAGRPDANAIREAIEKAGAGITEKVLAAVKPLVKANGERESKQILEQMAMALLLTIGPNAKKIAEKVGVPRTTLMSWETFKAAYDKKKGEAQAEMEKRRRRLKSADQDTDETDDDE